MRRALIPAVLFLACPCLAQDTALYYIVFLRPDPARATIRPADSERIQTAHMANIRKMAADGVLVAAGPFGDDAHAISGIFVMRAATLADAKRIAAGDPTVVEHRNTVDVHAWKGPAGIGVEYVRLHREHPETPENMGVHPLVIFSRGPKWDDAADQRARALAALDELVARLHREGKLAAAGRVDGDDSIVALVVFKRIPVPDAQMLLREYSAQTTGILRAEYHQWWSSDHVLPW
jgi:uncharacterized protein YciI